MDELERRKGEVLSFLKQNRDYVVYIILAAITFFGYYIRTRNLSLLKDAMTGKYIPADLDAFAFLRYAQYILDHGKLMVTDMMRYFPTGFNNPDSEFGFLSHFIVYLYKFLHFFDPSVTLEYADIIYPAICFMVGAVFFFLFVRKLFDYRVALISTAFLAVLPPFLYRTMTGVADKEAFAMMTMFAVLYFYVAGMKSKETWKTILFGVLSGLSTVVTALVWGGVQFIFVIIGAYALIEIALGRFDKNDFYLYSAWFIPLTFILLLSEKFPISSLIFSFTTEIIILAFIAGIVDFLVFKLDLLKIKHKFENKLPLGVASIGITILLAFIATLFIDPTLVFEKIYHLFYDIIYPLKDRWSLTVAESHQPYIMNWAAEMGWNYIFLFLTASILMFYELTKGVKKHTWKLVSVYAVLLFCIVFSRYSQDSRFNGVSPLAKFMLVGSSILFLAVILYGYINSYYKDKETFESLSRFDKTFIFTLIWFLVVLVGARIAARLNIVLAPATAVMFSFLIVNIYDICKSRLKEKGYQYASYAALAFIVLFLFWGFANSSLNQAKYTGTPYNMQWQVAMDWVRTNTSEDAVFAHWWDYGYWVQTGGERATVTDGGNAKGAWNFFMGRHVLTAQNETEALEFLKTHSANYLLMISDEIGKYPAFSSIGADENYDRYSWINNFNMDNTQTVETRDNTMFLYKGGTMLDDDVVYQGQIFPGGSAIIAGFIVPFNNTVLENSSTNVMDRPTAIFVYSNQRYDIPLNCAFLNEKEMIFGNDGLDGCIRFIPSIEGNKINPIDTILYLSPDVRKTLFTHLYLYGEKSENFEIAYTDERNMPLSIYNGRLIGPLKIWKISYPSNIKTNPIYLSEDFPNPEVTLVKR